MVCIILCACLPTCICAHVYVRTVDGCMEVRKYIHTYVYIYSIYGEGIYGAYGI